MKSRLVLAALIVSLATLAACSSSSSSSPSSGSGSSQAAGSGTGIKTISTKIGTVLTNTQGHTLYWFAPDTSTTSHCTGSCATYWPPVKGPVSAAAGISLPGKFATITRSDGSVQATYDGHPLYTYSGDTAAGQTTGNGLTASGGKWWAVTPSGSKPAPAASPSSSGGGGYGGY